MAWILFISFKLSVASSSDWPPERKVTALRAGGIVLERVLTVNHAISLEETLVGQSAPGVTMLGLRKQPSRNTLCK